MQLKSDTLERDWNGIKLKNLEKLYDFSARKIDIINYYIKMSSYIIPHIYDKPFSMIHFPDGVGGKFFYQKQMPINAPSWLESVKIPSKKHDFTEWCLVNDMPSIVYMVNRSVVEMHTWFSRLPNLDCPDIAVIDLDPSGNTGFNESRFVACAFRAILKQLNIYSVPKTSGGSGIHIYIPIHPTPFEKVQDFLVKLCRIVAHYYPKVATLERTVAKRGNRIYLDAIQNSRGKTIAAPYSLRAREGFPVSTPLNWDELANQKLSPLDFNIFNMNKRIETIGDILFDFYDRAQIIPSLNG